MKRSQKAERVVKEKFTRSVFPTLMPKNENQRVFAEALKSTSLVVAQGSAGTGKTVMACYHAAKKLHFNDIKKIVLLRAYQPLAGRTTGYLPGDLLTKLQPYYQQMLDYLEDCLGKASTEIALKNGVVEICGLETIRGRSWDNCIVIVDEAQNLYPQEVQALVTRMGENCQMIVCGDTAQTDVKKGKNGLAFLEEIVDRYNIPDAVFINFTTEDIVRSGMTRNFVIAFEEEAKAGRAI